MTIPLTETPVDPLTCEVQTPPYSLRDIIWTRHYYASEGEATRLAVFYYNHANKQVEVAWPQGMAAPEYVVRAAIQAEAMQQAKEWTADYLRSRAQF